MKLGNRLLLIVIILLVMVSTANARESEWKSKKYDFSTIKTIMYFEPVNTQTVQDTFAPKKAMDVMDEKLFAGNASLKFISFAEVLAKIQNDTGEDLQLLYKTNNARFLQILANNIPKYCDAILGTEILAMGYSTQYMEGYSFPVTQMQTSYVSGTVGQSRVSGQVTSPQTTYYQVPGGNHEVVNVGVRVTIYKPQNGEPIYSFSDVRDRVNKALNKTNTESMLERIVSNISEKIKSLPGSK